jgi:hypothetical protein
LLDSHGAFIIGDSIIAVECFSSMIIGHTR